MLQDILVAQECQGCKKNLRKVNCWCNEHKRAELIIDSHQAEEEGWCMKLIKCKLRGRWSHCLEVLWYKTTNWMLQAQDRMKKLRRDTIQDMWAGVGVWCWCGGAIGCCWGQAMSENDAAMALSWWVGDAIWEILVSEMFKYTIMWFMSCAFQPRCDARWDVVW
jgi:hypothetical protein